MSWEPSDKRWWTVSNRPMLKKAIVEPDKKFTQLTICVRFYHLAYNTDGHFSPIFLVHPEKKTIETNGYTEPISKYFVPEFLAPNLRSYDIVAFMRTSREGLENKNEWSYFRKSKRGMNALEWHHVCIVFNIPGKNTGIVLNGEIIGNRNHTDGWANEDNFFHSEQFAPYTEMS